MRALSKKGIAATASFALAFGLMTVGSTAAHADGAPSGADIVGVGSDTLQYMVDFGADGDFNGNAGYNTNKTARLESIDATPDANARAGWLNGSTSSAQKPLNPTVVLRAGTLPVQRPNGSGAGIGALAIDLNGEINFARSSSALSASQVTTATGTGGVGNLHEIRLAHETLSLAVGNTTNAPALSALQLKQIYSCAGGSGTGANLGWSKWTDVGGTSANFVIPILPQNGSGTRKTFLQDIGMTASDGTVLVAPGACVKTYEENDPYALYVDSSGNQVADPYATSAAPSADAIEPMSGARLALFANGYFLNPNFAYGVTPPGTEQSTLVPAVHQVLTGSPSDSNAVYTDKRGLYVIFRQSDITSTQHFNGSSVNWVNTLFMTASAYFRAPQAGAALMASAGVTPDWADCGMNPTSATACGPLT